MKCPKCGYNSFDHLESCKKCSNDLVGHKAQFGLRNLFFAKRHSEAPLGEPSVETDPGYPYEEQAAVNDFSVSGFDFMSEQEDFMDDSSEASLDGLLGGEGSLETDEDFLHEKAEPVPVSFADAPMDGPSLEDGTEEPSELDFAWDEAPSSASMEVATGGCELDLGPLEGSDDLSDPLPAADFNFEADFGGGEITENENAISEGGQDRSAESVLEENLAELFLDSLDEPAFTKKVLAEDFPPGGDLPTLGEGLFGEDPFLPSMEVTEAEPGLADDDAEEDREEECAVSGADVLPPLTARIGAGVADVVILALVFVLFLAAGEMALSTTRGGGVFPAVETLLELAIPYFLVLFAVFFGYFTLFHFLIGQTPGKILFRLRVEGEQGGGLLFSQAFLRSVGGLLSLLPAGIGFLRIVLDRERRGWNDRMANSRVVRVAGWRNFEETAEGGLPEEI